MRAAVLSTCLPPLLVRKPLGISVAGLLLLLVTASLRHIVPSASAGLRLTSTLAGVMLLNVESGGRERDVVIADQCQSPVLGTILTIIRLLRMVACPLGTVNVHT